jgi:hypothetical protein
MTCSICNHAERLEIDRQLVERVPLRHIAQRTGTTATALCRHKRAHLARTLVKAAQVEEVANATTLLSRVEGLVSRCQTIAANAAARTKTRFGRA